MLKKYLTLILIVAINLPFYAQSTKDSLTYNYLDYAGSKYYLLPDGRKVLDKRKTGALNPTLFSVARTDEYSKELYFTNEEEGTGCNLEEPFRKYIFPDHGVNIRKYLNALSGSNCSSLSSYGEKQMCAAYKGNANCRGALPLALLALPLAKGESYLTHQSIPSFSCAEAESIFLKNTFVPRESTQWKKIKRDLIDSQRKVFLKNLKKNPPRAEITQQIRSKNPSASKREIDFAIQDYIYEQGVKFTAEITDSEIQQVAQMRYAPYGMMKNLQSFSKSNGGLCSKIGGRYKAKMYGEMTNVPPHLLLLFADYINQKNQCICH